MVGSEDAAAQWVIRREALFMRQSRSVQLDSRSICNFIARLCCTLVRQNCRCDIGLSIKSHVRWCCSLSSVRDCSDVMPVCVRVFLVSVVVHSLVSVVSWLIVKRSRMRSCWRHRATAPALINSSKIFTAAITSGLGCREMSLLAGRSTQCHTFFCRYTWVICLMQSSVIFVNEN